MTDRVNMLYVILEKDTREDDIEATQNAIQQLRGVLKVEKHIASPEATVAEIRVKSELMKKLIEVLYPDAKTGKT